MQLGGSDGGRIKADTIQPQLFILSLLLMAHYNSPVTKFSRKKTVVFVSMIFSLLYIAIVF